jgi:hypothetical protein
MASAVKPRSSLNSELYSVVFWCFCAFRSDLAKSRKHPRHHSMAILRYPIPYQIYAVPKGKRLPRIISVAAEAAFEIPEHDDISAPVVAEFQMEWPYGVFPISTKANENATHLQRPMAELRYAGGHFFTAVYITDKGSHRPAKVDELEEVMGGERHLATVMTHLYATIGDEMRSRLKAQRNEKLRSLDETPHSDRQVGGEVELQNSEVMFNFAKDDAAKYISVDGHLWRRVGEEPCLIYEVDADKRSIQVSVKKSSHIGSKALSRSFSLSRFDDLLDHLETHYPSYNVTAQVSDVNVIHPEAFTIDHDAISMWRTAYELRRGLEQHLAGLEEIALDAWYDLRDEAQRTNDTNVGERGQLLADIVNRLTAQLPDDRKFEFARIELQRWEMRPVTAQSHRSRF